MDYPSYFNDLTEIKTIEELYQKIFLLIYVPAGTRRCSDAGFWLSFGRDVGQHRSNVVTTLSFRRRCSDQNLTFLQRCVSDVDSPTRY